MNQPESTILRYKQAGSDKVYEVHLEHSTLSGWVVNIAYGRHGSALRTTTKTPEALSEYTKAKKIYDRTVAQKIAKGYEAQNIRGQELAYESGLKKSGIPPVQLANPVDDQGVIKAMTEWGGFYLQTKWDGERRPVHLNGESVIPGNRRGFRTSIFPPIKEQLKQLYKDMDWKGSWYLDGEDLGEKYVIFDLMLPDTTFTTRYQWLQAMNNIIMADDVLYANIMVDLPFFISPKNMDRYYDIKNVAKEFHEEGIIIRNPAAQYTGGRPNSGGDLLKLKFIESVTCMVTHKNPGKRSVALCVRGSNYNPVSIGNVTIPPNYEIPKPGDMVEVEYLYAYPDGGKLYQPQYKGLRTDKKQADFYNTLKFKK